MPHRAIRLTLAALVVAAVIWPISANAATTHTVSVGNNFFSPADVSIKRGDSVKWAWHSRGRTHNVTSRKFTGSGNRARGSFTKTFNRAGKYPYVCTLHRGMQGIVNVSR